MEGKTALGASSPANPALQRPDPLSQTRAVLSSSSHMTAGGAVDEQRHYDTDSHCRKKKSEVSESADFLFVYLGGFVMCCVGPLGALSFPPDGL